MKQDLLSGVIAVSAAFLAFAVGTVAARAAETCKPFTIMSDEGSRSVEYLDFGNDGLGPGDMRIGRRGVVNEAGDHVGHYRWIARSLDAPPGSGKRGASFVNMMFALNDGQIHFQTLPEAIRPPDDTTKVHVANFTAVVVGGTGAYSFARGTVDTSFDGTAATYTFNIRCD